MKKYSTFNEALCATTDKNPGNSLSCGISNHYTPVENIVTNVKNLFCAMLGVVAAVGEDGVSVKLHSTQFTSEKNVYDRLYNIMYNSQSLYSYITQQGLTACKLVNVGQYFIVYFSPVDLANATAANDAVAKELAKCCDGCAPCSEMLDMNIEEAELSTINESNDEDEEELEKIRAKEVTTVLKMKDKVKAAKELGIMVSQQISLPTEYYFSGVKSKDGDESIALRWKYIKRRPHGKSIEIIGARENNLKDINVKIPLGTFNCVTGVSGSGKSTLVNEVLYKYLAKEINKSNEKPGKCDKIKGIENIIRKTSGSF